MLLNPPQKDLNKKHPVHADLAAHWITLAQNVRLEQWAYQGTNYYTFTGGTKKTKTA